MSEVSDARTEAERVAHESAIALATGEPVDVFRVIESLQKLLRATGRPAPEVPPEEILEVLFRALTWAGPNLSDENRSKAWVWLEERNPYEWMGD